MWTEKEERIIRDLAYQYYLERLERGWDLDEKMDWQLAEWDFLERQS